MSDEHSLVHAAMINTADQAAARAATKHIYRYELFPDLRRLSLLEAGRTAGFLPFHDKYELSKPKGVLVEATEKGEPLTQSVQVLGPDNKYHSVPVQGLLFADPEGDGDFPDPLAHVYVVTGLSKQQTDGKDYTYANLIRATSVKGLFENKDRERDTFIKNIVDQLLGFQSRKIDPSSPPLQFPKSQANTS